jgi:hypothetical protein
MEISLIKLLKKINYFTIDSWLPISKVPKSINLGKILSLDNLFITG